MPLPPEESVILFFTWIWALSEVIGSHIIPRLRQRGKDLMRADRGSLFVIWFSIFASIFIIVYFGTNEIAPLPEFFFGFGLALMIFGIIFRQYSIWILGRFFSVRVRIASRHHIVQDGPYKYLRHPSYTGALLIFIGLGLASRTWLGTLLIVAVFFLVYGYRMNVEEAALRKNFGRKYDEYIRRTNRLIPYVY